MIRFSFAIFSTVLLINTGCIETTTSDLVSPASIYQGYSVSYDEDGSALEATAQFTVGGSWGTTVELRSPSTIEFNGRSLKRENFLGTSYRTEWTGQPFQALHRFEWTDQEGRVYLNSVSITPIRVSSSPSSLQKSSRYVVSTAGEPLTRDDQLALHITGESATGTLVATVDGKRDGDYRATFDLGAHPSAQKLLPGRAKLKLIRSRIRSLQRATPEGGSIRAEYITRAIQVEVLE